MDPKAKRFMWDVINNTMSNRCLVLTSHSMEECEALCSRIGIMAAGKLQCLGDPQHLKSTHAPGYRVLFTVRAASSVSSDTQAVAVTCPPGLPPGGCLEIQMPDNGGVTTVQVPAGVTAGQTFEAIVGVSPKLKLREWVMQTFPGATSEDRDDILTLQGACSGQHRSRTAAL